MDLGYFVYYDMTYHRTGQYYGSNQLWTSAKVELYSSAFKLGVF